MHAVDVVGQVEKRPSLHPALDAGKKPATLPRTPLVDVRPPPVQRQVPRLEPLLAAHVTRERHSAQGTKKQGFHTINTFASCPRKNQQWTGLNVDIWIRRCPNFPFPLVLWRISNFVSVCNSHFTVDWNWKNADLNGCAVVGSISKACSLPFFIRLLYESSSQLNLNFEIVTGTQALTTKWSRGSKVDHEEVNTDISWKRELRSWHGQQNPFF